MFSFGSDPEFILIENGLPVSAIGVLPPKKEQLINEGSGFYFDNVLAECAIKPGATQEEVIENTRSALKFLGNSIRPRKISLHAAQNFSESELAAPEAREAGCKPEWCVYAIQVVRPPVGSITASYLRTAGGHVHLGGVIAQEDRFKPQLIMMLDLFLGIPSVLLDRDPTSIERRRVYGLAGRHRIPKHGIEYRTLSNFWFASPKLVALVYDLCEFTIKFVAEDGFHKLWRIDEDLLYGDYPAQGYQCIGYDVEAMKQQINACNRWGAEQFMPFLAEYLPESLISRIQIAAKERLNPLHKEWGLSPT